MHVVSGRLVPLLRRFRAAPEPVWAVYPQRRHFMPEVRSLADAIAERLQDALDAR